MPKKSTAKQTAAPAPKSLKAPKTRLTKHMRDTLYRHMCGQLLHLLDGKQADETLAALVSRANAILRAKYPEEDMPVLRKYDMVHVDSCLRFSLPESGRVFGVQFSQPNVLRTEAKLVDIPCRSGCYNRDVYACDSAFEALADKWEKQIHDRALLISEKEREHNSFLLSCRYLEDVEAVVPLTEEIRNTIGAQARSLTVINPDVLSRIKSDFAQGVAA